MFSLSQNGLENELHIFAYQNYINYGLLRSGHWTWTLEQSWPTSHPMVFLERKENLNLLVTCALPLCIGNREAVSP